MGGRMCENEGSEEHLPVQQKNYALCQDKRNKVFSYLWSDNRQLKWTYFFPGDLALRGSVKDSEKDQNWS